MIVEGNAKQWTDEDCIMYVGLIPFLQGMLHLDSDNLENLSRTSVSFRQPLIVAAVSAKDDVHYDGCVGNGYGTVAVGIAYLGLVT